ncbi:hypothetical protein DOM22_10770 [Bdellovibrio sp. ZAP7]|uniref:hypothetical protein n=1 Tax=Bdellovibrio sp. ZAP7 TaxID=2231053 RepID=UPI00115BD343|nr:hypothetical protein [Bdellovibrio sp. ZAP7]QDK45596.1 hypothetical protein DOM22_10770 [Bdellovibrio sp. ZAP7]
MKNCFSKVIFTVLIFCSFAAHAQMFSGLMPPSKQRGVLTYTGSIQPDTTFNSTDGKASLNRGTVITSVPVYKTEKESYGVSMLGHWMDLYPDQAAMPDLYQFDVGLTYTRMVDEKAYWALNGNFGSASDKPFKDPSVDTIGGNFFYIDPVDETGSWVYLVNYSNNRPILNGIPLPGFAYMYTPSKTFRGTFGAPFATIYWEFVDRWSLNFFTLIPWVIKTSVDYSIAGPMKASLGLDFSQSTYYLYGRANRKERLFYDEKRVYVGFKTPLSMQFMTEVEAGYSFDRRYFQDENYDISPKNAIHLGTSPYLKLQLTSLF